jgi:hypothetical protein
MSSIFISVNEYKGFPKDICRKTLKQNQKNLFNLKIDDSLQK